MLLALDELGWNGSPCRVSAGETARNRRPGALYLPGRVWETAGAVPSHLAGSSRYNIKRVAITMSDLSEIYNARILELAAETSRAGRLGAPDATATAHSKLCGSTVTVDLVVTDGRIADYAQVIKACLLGQAAATVVAREIVGSTPAEIRDVGATMRAMLKEGGTSPAGRWADLAVLQPVRDYRARHASTLLVFDAVDRALDALGANVGVNARQVADSV